MGKLFKQLSKPETIWRAWSVVLENGRTSKSARTRAEIAAFAADAPKLIQKIAWSLPRGRYRFEPAHGVAIPKKNKKDKRPVVMAPISNRIVQRAVLDVVQSIPAIKEKLKRGRNFGGIEGVGVPKAIKEAYLASRAAGHFIRTDIKAFFDNVPRELAIAKIVAETRDPEFDEILRQATTTELSNLSALGRDRELFPLEEIGVAQGSALSPLLCNLLLEDIDEQLNGRGVSCIRYIDDFILFAPDRKKAFLALASARRALQVLNSELDCYDPTQHTDKVEEGSTSTTFHFLGCEIAPDVIRPTRDARKRLLDRVQTLFKNALSATGDPEKAIREHRSYVETLNTASNVIRGWGNTYSFCTDDRLMRDLDRQIDQLLVKFRGQYRRIAEKSEAQDRRRLTGVFLIADCNKDEEIRSLVKAAQLGRKRET